MGIEGNIHLLRLAKLCYIGTHPKCWKPGILGVAPSIEHQKVIREIDADVFIDVGANKGQFSLMTRLTWPTVKIYAFEPLSSEAAVFKKVFANDQYTQPFEMALGEFCGTAEIHVSQKADSSSLLPIGELQGKLFPSTIEIGTRSISVATLDSRVEVWQGARRACLKIDVQGFELSVLKGARNALRHCAFVYAECSEVPLYTGQALFSEVKEFLLAEGFKSVRRANEQFVDGRLIQADHLFSRI
jgi:FkbM family methyltransferase